MINSIYQLISPKTFSIKHKSINCTDRVLVRPTYLAICHADQRYYLGQRDVKILRKKLPMALIHEGCGVVVSDPTNTFKIGQKVVMIPNDPQSSDEIIKENYARDSRFLSSGYDGFMREVIDFRPDRLVSFEEIEEKVAAITEFVSVGVQAITRFKENSHDYKDVIGVWGDGSLSYVVANILKIEFPKSKIVVIGRNERKLSQFSFVDNTYYSDSLPSNLKINHAFECCGGDGSYYAIDDIIKFIEPQGSIVLMGVSENKVAINTRDILEKGLNLLGSSRSGREDFKKSIELLENKAFQNRIKTIIYEDEAVRCIDDIRRVFSTDMNSPFKTVFKWDM